MVAYGGPTHQHARESGRWKVEATRGEGPTEYGGWLRAGFIAGLACAVVAFGGQPDAASGVGPVKVTFSDVIIERTPCKDGQTSAGRQVGGLPGPGNGREMSERPDFTNGCFTVSALANNPGKKELRNADVFGRVYDKYGNTTRDDTENIRLSYIETIPPGTSRVEFGFIVNSVFAAEGEKDGGLTIQGLKASGFAGGVMPGQGNGTVGQPDCDDFAREMGECESLPF